jgi:CRISPR-associated protein Csb1
LDSVQSQANRLEELLLEAVYQKEIPIPRLEAFIDGYGTISSLEAPHRAFDAIFRDCQIDGIPFRKSKVGQKLIISGPKNASAMFGYCPNALLFGSWDSTSGEGNHGIKLERCITSEIIGWDATKGVATSSRLDPLQIRKGIDIYARKGGGWTVDEERAEKDNSGKPMLHKKKTTAGINHSNYPPQIDEKGVSISKAEQTSVLSLIHLRRLKFPGDDKRNSIPERDLIGRTVLACMGLYCLSAQVDSGYDLRSRCVLIPSEYPEFEIIGRTLEERKRIKFETDELVQALKEAIEEAKEIGLPWEEEPTQLKPSEDLQFLIQKSKEMTVKEEEEEIASD